MDSLLEQNMSDTKKEVGDVQQYIEIWKSCVELHKFHDQLRKERARRFTLIQIALAGSFAFSLRTAVTANSAVEFGLLCSFAFCAAIGGLIYSNIMTELNARTLDYVKTVKNQTQNVERVLAPMMPQIEIFPYTGQYRVLNEKSLSINEYGVYDSIDQRDSLDHTTVGGSKKGLSGTAHEMEQLMVRIVSIAWSIGIIGWFAFTITLSQEASWEKAASLAAASKNECSSAISPSDAVTPNNSATATATNWK